MMEACFISCQLSNHKYKTKPDDVNVFFFFINWPFFNFNYCFPIANGQAFLNNSSDVFVMRSVRKSFGFNPSPVCRCKTLFKTT